MEERKKKLVELISPKIEIIESAISSNRDKNTVIIEGVEITQKEALEIFEEFKKILNSSTEFELDYDVISLKLLSSSPSWREIQSAINNIYHKETMQSFL